MRIPSHRNLAEQFEVNRVTIIKSIELLEAEGFIYTKKGSGTYVNDYLSEAFVFNKWLEMMEWSSRTRSQYTVQLINKLETDSNYIHISKGEIGEDILPHFELKHALNKVSTYIGELSFGYNNGYGYIKLRELIAERLKHDGIYVSSKNVLITSGALHALQLLVTGFLSQNTVIFSNSPSYIDSTHVFNILNMRKVSYDSVDHFRKIIGHYPNYKDKAIYIDPTFNNPTGYSLSKKEKKEIVNYSSTYNIPVIEDDIYKDIWFDDKPSPPVKAFDVSGNVIHISSFSKSIAPAIRIGWVIASEKVVEQLADIRMQIDYGSSILSQMVVYELLRSGDYDNHISRLRKILKEKRDHMIKILNEHFSTFASWDIPEGGFFIWLTFKDDLNIKQLFSNLIDYERILINPGFIYGSEENAIRLSYAYESKNNIEHALLKIKEYVMSRINI